MGGSQTLGCMKAQHRESDVRGEYVLATGEAATHRLQVLHSLYGPGARRVLLRAGRDLFRMIIAANFSSPEITFNQPVVARGKSKRFLELSVAEAGPAFLAAGLVTHEELARLLADMQRIAEDETVLAVMPRMSQVWARKLVPSTSPSVAD